MFFLLKLLSFVSAVFLNGVNKDFQIRRWIALNNAVNRNKVLDHPV